MKNYIHEIHNCKEGAIIRKDYDVLMIGGGVSRLCTAIASARQGARAATVQDRSVLDKNASPKVEMRISGTSCHWGKKGVVETGIPMELQLGNKYLNDSYNYSIWDDVLWSVAMNYENLDVYTSTTMDMVNSDGSCTHYAQCYQMTTENRYEFGTKVFANAMGNGTLGYFAGAEYKTGREVVVERGGQDASGQADGETMGSTIHFVAEDVGHPVKSVGPGWAHIFIEEDFVHRHHGDIMVYHNMDDVMVLKPGEDHRDHEGELMGKHDAKSGYWWTELDGDQDDIIKQLEDIRHELYRTVYDMWDHIKNDGDHGAENHELTWVGNLGGMGESCRLMGDYVLTEQDILFNRMSKGMVAYGGWPVDERAAAGFRAKEQIPSWVRSFKGLYPIPYGCFRSRTVKNLMMMGRNISASKLAMGSIRVMGTCAVGGKTVGVAAANAALSRPTPSEYGRLHKKELQQKLLKDNLYVPGCKNEGKDNKARPAKLSVTSQRNDYEVENLIFGITRWEGDRSNLWMSKDVREGGKTVVLELKEPLFISQVRLVFDPDSGEERCISVSRTFMEKEPRDVAKTLVKDYRVEALFGGKTVACRGVRDNYQRLNVVEFDETAMVDAARITFQSTNGCGNAQMYEVRIY